MINFKSSDLVSSKAAIGDMSLGSGQPGVYCIFFDSGQLVFERSGYLNFDNGFPLSVDGFDLMYVGAALYDMRARLISHLVGNSKTSTLRMTFGALFGDDIGLDPVSDDCQTCFDFGIGEGRLSAWLIENTKVVLLPSADPFKMKQELVFNRVLPFNVTERPAHSFSKHVQQLHTYIVNNTDRISDYAPVLGAH